MQSVLFVSVAQSFEPGMTLAQLEPWVERAWAMTVAKASSADRVVAVFEDRPIAAWVVRGAFPTEETYRLSNHDERPRVGLSLGEPLPILAAYYAVPALRHGVSLQQIDCEPLPSERG